MNTIFYFPGMLLTQLSKDTKKKLSVPSDPEKYDPEVNPHWHVFVRSHVGRALDTSDLEGNALVIAEIPEDKIRKVTLDDLEKAGVILYEPSYLV